MKPEINHQRDVLFDFRNVVWLEVRIQFDATTDRQMKFARFVARKLAVLGV